MTNEELCKAVQQGNLDARNDLVANNQPYVTKKARELWYSQRKLNRALGIEIEDLQQEGLVGLLEAISLYRQGTGASFLTYAAIFINNAMIDYIRKVNSRFEGRNLSELVSIDDMKYDERLSNREIIVDPRIKNPLNICVKKVMYEDLRKALFQIDLRGRTYLLYRFGFLDDVDHCQIETAKHFHLSLTRGKATEVLALDNVWLELPWWY